uniref:Uncharacterized protein n=1 Tax=Strombidium rassoulzadegani TaxID=1082188 RepID=A0A7S3CUC3_9SPIT
MGLEGSLALLLEVELRRVGLVRGPRVVGGVVVQIYGVHLADLDYVGHGLASPAVLHLPLVLEDGRHDLTELIHILLIALQPSPLGVEGLVLEGVPRAASDALWLTPPDVNLDAPACALTLLGGRPEA